MNRIYTTSLIAMFAMAIFSVSLALAEDNSTNISEPMLISEPINVPVNDTNSSISEDETVSGWKYGWEKFKLNFVWNDTKKAEGELQLARWKIAEAKFAMRNGNVDKAEKAMQDHDALLLKIEDILSRMGNKSLPAGLDQAIKVHEEKLANLNLVLQSANLTDSQKAKVEERIAKLENNSQHLEEVRAKIGDKRQVTMEKIENKTQRAGNISEKVRERIQNRTQNVTQNKERIRALRNLTNSTE